MHVRRRHVCGGGGGGIGTVFAEGIRLGIAMLDGGNMAVQATLYERVDAGQADAFFRALRHKLEEATQDGSDNSGSGTGAAADTGARRTSTRNGADDLQSPTTAAVAAPASATTGGVRPTGTRTAAAQAEEYRLTTGILRLLQLLCENHIHDLQVGQRMHACMAPT
jgi:hypothetical protein